MANQHIAHQLSRLAVPLIPTHGFTSHCLSIASSQLPSTSTSTPFNQRTLDALYPSPPLAIESPTSFSLKGLLIGNGGKRSLTRQELVSLAQDRGIVPGSELARREKVGPAKALVEAWLEEGRKEMIEAIRESGFKGERAMRKGIRARLEYNERVLDRLPEALALLSARTTTPLSAPSTLIPIPSPFPHFEHVAKIAQDLAKASGSEAQGTAWYSLRLRLSLIYTLSELHLLSFIPAPTASPSPAVSSDLTTPTAPLPANSHSEAIASSVRYSEKLFDETAKVGNSIDGIGQFGSWVVKSWMGIGRSLGV